MIVEKDFNEILKNNINNFIYFNNRRSFDIYNYNTPFLFYLNGLCHLKEIDIIHFDILNNLIFNGADLNLANNLFKYNKPIKIILQSSLKNKLVIFNHFIINGAIIYSSDLHYFIEIEYIKETSNRDSDMIEIIKKFLEYNINLNNYNNRDKYRIYFEKIKKKNK